MRTRISPGLLNTKFQWLQYRILQNILTTNYSVSKYDPNQDPKCTFCKLQPETVEHLFWNCFVVQKYLTDLNLWFVQNIGKDLISTKVDFILGIRKTGDYSSVYNQIIIIIKNHIYTSKCLNSNLSTIKTLHYLKELYNQNKMLALKNNKIEMFENEWIQFHALLNGNT